MTKFTKIFAIVMSVVFLATVVTACTPEGLEAHNWSSKWSSNSKSHWHVCLDAGCNGRDSYGEHEWELTTVYVAATCGDTGLGQYTCSVCKATLGNETTPATIPATGEHSYKLEAVDVEPSCGDNGYGSYICEICYDYAVQLIPATGEHNFGGKYQSNEDGHYRICLNGCGATEETQSHKMGEGVRIEPSGTKDGRIEYRCETCNYLMNTDVIPNPNVLDHFEVKFVSNSNSSVVAIPEMDAEGELYVTLKTSSNAFGGYKLEFVGYNANGDTVTVSNNGVKLYYYNEYTGEKTELRGIENSGEERVGFMGYISGMFYISRATTDTSLLIEITQSGRESVSLKVHIRTA